MAIHHINIFFHPLKTGLIALNLSCTQHFVMELLQIINTDSFRKVIIDSMALAQKQQLSSIDYVAKVDSFYNGAWTKLVGLFALIGIIIPLFINFLQVKRNEKDQQKIKEDLKTELTGEIEVYLKGQVNKIQHATEGVSYHIQAQLYLAQDKYRDAFGEYVNALTCYFLGDDYDNFKNALDDLLTCFGHIDRNDIIEIRTTCSEYYDIAELIKKLEVSEDKNFRSHMQKLRYEYEKLG